MRIRKKIIYAVLSALLILSVCFNSYAEYASYQSTGGMEAAIEIATGPLIFTPDGTAIGPHAPSSSSSSASSSSSSGSYSSSSSSSSSGSQGAVISSGPGVISSSSSSSSSSSASSGTSSSAGSDHSSDAAYSIDLGFTLISPAHEYGDYLVAEGSVQLSDGTWVELGYDQYIYGHYYRLLREVTDKSGVEWYVVAYNGTIVGNYTTEDGSVITELWLKKDDCEAVSSLTVNTSSTLRHNIIRTALSLLGNAYEYGEAGPDTYDCSGFVYYIMGLYDISIPRSSSEIIAYGTEVGLTGLVPGDIVGRSGHVGIYIGGDWFVHSSDTHTGVLTDSIELYNSSAYAFTNYRNVIGD